jgi:hypothetical protein
MAMVWCYPSASWARRRVMTDASGKQGCALVTGASSGFGAEMS